MNRSIDHWTLDSDGHLIDGKAWSPDFAEAIASTHGITLREDHWWLIGWVRDYYQAYGNPPLMRSVVVAYRAHKRDPSLGSAALYALFDEHPIRWACLLGGLPKPDWCL